MSMLYDKYSLISKGVCEMVTFHLCSFCLNTLLVIRAELILFICEVHVLLTHSEKVKCIQ